MKPRPFYRSRLFLLGLPGLVFLLWAWWDSMKTETEARMRWGNSRISVTVRHYGGELAVTYWPGSFGGSLVPQSFQLHRQIRGDSANWFSRVKVSEIVSIGDGFRRAPRLFLPHWLLLLCYLCPWLGVGWWWQRRKSRLMNLHAAP